MAGLYVHIPFCHSKCAYCDFYSRPCNDIHIMRDYIAALENEYSRRSPAFLETGGFDTAYIGGGTPSSLPTEDLVHLITMPHGAVRGEYTMECNPEDVTPEAVGRWLEAGINRVSMGVQSFSDNELKSVGRGHTSARAIEAVEQMRTSGVNELSLDLIYGLPEQTFESWKQSLSLLLVLRPEHFSAYALSLEPGTRLYARMLAGKYTSADDDFVAEMYDYLCAEAAKAGYEHYEISNFALPGHRSRHNSSYWRGEAYLGLGCSAVSYDGKATRRTGVADIKTYIDASGMKGKSEEESPKDIANDTIFTALRTAEGLDPNRIRSAVGENIVSQIYVAAQPMLDAGTLTIGCDGNLRIPERHWLISDSIIRDLLIE